MRHTEVQLSELEAGHAQYSRFRDLTNIFRSEGSNSADNIKNVKKESKLLHVK
jgi:hypothetical protein